MTKRITALFLTLVTLLGLVAVPANAASTLEEAMAEVNVYARNDDLDWLRVNPNADQAKAQRKRIITRITS